MRVLSKSELDNCVKFDELTVMLENFGVKKSYHKETEVNADLSEPFDKIP